MERERTAVDGRKSSQRPQRSHHEVADVLSEEYLYANNNGGERTQAVARVHFRTARRHMDDLSPMLKRFEELRPLP